MKQHGGVWLPDGEEHLTAWMSKVNHVVDGKLTYQFSKLTAALAYVRDWHGAIDVGAHCGLMSMHLVKRFARVDAFEPVEEHRRCFAMNVGTGGRPVASDSLAGFAVQNDRFGCLANLWPYACGEKPGLVTMRTEAFSSGNTYPDPAAAGGNVKVVRIDDVIGRDADVGFLKADAEGYELFALRGAEQTLRRCRPVVMVEQKPGMAQKFGLPETGAVDFLRSLGAELKQTISGDYILAWPA